MNDYKTIYDSLTQIEIKGTDDLAHVELTDEIAHFPYTNPNNYSKVGFPKKSGHDYSKDYLTFEMLQDARIGFVDGEGGTISSFSTSLIKYRINNGEWIDYSIIPDPINNVNYLFGIDAHKGDIVQFKTNVDYLFQEYAELGFACNSSHEGPIVDISGNIMSLVDAENFASMKAFPEISGSSNPWNFYNTFTFAYPRSAKNLILPALNMNGASYAAMFSGCSNLIEAPTLSATTLTNECYSEMFANCTNLTTAPELPATTLASDCYNSMFNGCTSLNYVKCLAKENIIGTNTDSWLANVSETGTFVGDPTSSWPIGGDGVPQGWTTNVNVEKDG